MARRLVACRHSPLEATCCGRLHVLAVEHRQRKNSRKGSKRSTCVQIERLYFRLLNGRTNENVFLGPQVRLPLRELLYKSCMERSQKCLHYAPRGRISQFNQSEIYGNIKSAWCEPPSPPLMLAPALARSSRGSRPQTTPRCESDAAAGIRPVSYDRTTEAPDHWYTS